MIEARLTPLIAEPGEPFVVRLLAAWDRGDAVVPLDPGMSEPARTRLLTELRPDEPVASGVALVVPTSGTSGRPKGVELTHDALTASAQAAVDRLGASGQDRWLCCLPVHHVAGLQVVLRARLSGGSLVIHDRFDPDRVAAEQEATIVSLVPTMLWRLLEAGVDLSRFSAVLLGGAAAGEELLERARQAAVRVVRTYGMTETAGGCVYDGIPLEGVEVRIDGGLIGIRGPMLMRGYRCQPDLTRRSLADGWFVTGDLGRWGTQGRLEVLGRADDVIITGGENVHAEEVAALLRGHPAVAQVAVRGRPDPQWGERVVAYIVPADGQPPPDLDSVRRYVGERATPFKAPREVVIVDELPTTALGKPVREGSEATPEGTVEG